MKASVLVSLGVVLLCGVAHTSEALAEDASLRVLIDQHTQPVSGLVPASCSDAEFLRRVSLDLVGMPPTADEARAFIADPSADKRERLVDRLLASPHYARHLASTLDLMLMERRANTHVSADEWLAWLLKSVREDKPWNVLAREILAADGDHPTERAAVRFALDRGSEPNLLTHDVSRIFFGRDMQCAQCHDHPLVDDYLQSDYHGLLAYLAPSYAVVRKEGDKQITLQAERAGSDLAFESVFEKGTQHRTGPRIPGDVALDEPFFLPGDEYEVAPAENVKSIPKFSRRVKLAELATSGSNQAFNQNIANRLWAHMLGRGLVHPLDLHHPDNPATSPELLRLLGERFAAMNYDVRGFLREIALSGTYQRSFDAPADLTAAAADAAEQVRSIEQLQNDLAQAATASADAFSRALDAWHQAETALLPAAGALDAARNVYAEARKKADEASKALADATAQEQLKRDLATAVDKAAAEARQAAEALPEEKELADIARTLVARSGQLAAELVPLAKAVEERTAALKPLADSLDNARSAVDTALAAYTPLKSTLLQAEQTMLAARRQAGADAEALAACDQRLARVRRMAQLAERNQALIAANQAVSQREAELAAAQDPQQVGTATDAIAAAKREVAARQSELDAVVGELNELFSGDFTLAPLKPLTPEQLCWSVFRATGVYDRYWQAEVAELDKTHPLTDEQKQDPARQASRAVELEQKTFDKLKGNVATFVTFYGAAAGQPQGDFFSTADQALFAANGGAINSWVAPGGGNVTERMIQQTDLRVAAEELYLAVLTRLPTEEEIAEVSQHLAARAEDRSVAAQELVWGLLNSAEFRFNH